MRLHSFLLAAALLAAPASAALAAEHYVAPVGAVLTCTPTGSKECPWTSVSAAFSSKKVVGGDTVLLMDGDHAGIKLYMVAPATQVTIRSLNGKNAHVEWIYLQDGVHNLTFQNLSVWPTNPYEKVGHLVLSTAATSSIVADGLDVRAGKDAANYMSWSQTEWLNRANGGVKFSGTDSTISNSTFLGVQAAVTTAGVNSTILNNRIEGYSADALRALADNSLIKGNYAVNCVGIDDNHTDGFQSWADADGVTRGLTIEGNTIIEWNGAQDHPLRCLMQGIGMFDGAFEDIVISNNVISVSYYHGLSVYGGKNVKILNNTVVRNDGTEGSYPYIGIFPNKNGTEPSNVLVANNLAMSVNAAVAAGTTTLYNNSSLTGLANIFEDITTFNYKPKAASGFIDTADAAHAPPTDILGVPRPTGAGPDRGAYEVGGTVPTTTDGTTTGGTTGGTTDSTGGTTDGSTGGTTTTDGTTTDGTTTCTTTSGGGPKTIKLNGKAPCPKK